MNMDRRDLITYAPIEGGTGKSIFVHLIWAIVLLFVLTSGNPDLLDAIVSVIHVGR
jgi:hypothetical protein